MWIFFIDQQKAAWFESEQCFIQSYNIDIGPTEISPKLSESDYTLRMSHKQCASDQSNTSWFVAVTQLKQKGITF